VTNKNKNNDSKAWLVFAVWVVFIAVLTIGIVKHG